MCYWESQKKFHVFEIQAAWHQFGIGFTISNWKDAIDLRLYFLFFAVYLSIDKTEGKPE